MQTIQDTDAVSERTQDLLEGLPEKPRIPTVAKSWKRLKNAREIQDFVTNNLEDIRRKARIFCRGDSSNAEDVVQELYPRLLRVLDQSSDYCLHNPNVRVNLSEHSSENVHLVRQCL